MMTYPEPCNRISLQDANCSITLSDPYRPNIFSAIITLKMQMNYEMDLKSISDKLSWLDF